MEFNWIGRTDAPRLSWGYNGEGAEEAHKAAIARDDIKNEAVLLRGKFFAEKGIAHASASICGLGFYRFWINGKRISDAAMAPLETNYRKRVLYDEYTVTDAMRKGENIFVIELGCGRYSTPVKYWGWRARWHGDPLAALFAEITYEDGEKTVFKTGSGWKTALSPIGRNCFYDGEYYDAREEKPGFFESSFDDNSLPGALEVSPPSENIEKNEFYHIKKHRKIECASKKEAVNGVYVCDFGENIAGWVKIYVRGKRGTKITIRYAEQLADTVDTRSMRYAKNTDTYIMKGEGIEEYEPSYTLHGFSCAEITIEDCRAELIDAEAYEVYADCAQSGGFWCDNEKINRLHDVILRTQRAALQSYPIDCPQRDERLGWLADAHVTDLTCMYNYNMHNFYRKWFEDIHLDCHSESGAVTQIAPRVDFEHAVDWSSGFAIILWDCYLFYKDKELLKRYVGDIKRYVQYLGKNGPILDMSRYGDWMSTVPGWKRGEPRCCTTLYYCYNISLLIKMLDELEEESEEYKKLWDSVVCAVNKEFYNEENKLFGDGTQFSQSLAIKLGIIPPKDKKAAGEMLCRDIINNNYRLTCGILGTKYVMEVLSECDRELAMKVLMQESYPGWFDLISGKTTLAESWDGSGSQNHCMFGSVDAIFYSMLAGINIDKDITIKPYFAENINHVKCHTETAGGRISVSWIRDDDGIELFAEAEEEVLLILPDGTKMRGKSFNLKL